MNSSLQTLHFDSSVAVVGDIHGCAHLLRALLERLGDLPIVVLGDIGDRGPDTRDVIEMLVERSAFGVMGNHDRWLIRWAEGKGFDRFALNPIMGGQATLASYGVQTTSAAEIESLHRCVPREHRQWLKSMSIAIALDVGSDSPGDASKYWLTHAGIPRESVALVPEETDVIGWLVENRPQDLRASATLPRDVPKLERTLIMGHQPAREPLDLGHVIALDTGAGFENGRLSALILPERRFVTVG